MKLASYNIHSCRGVGGSFDPGRVADVIRETGADIVAFQEVDARERAGRYLDQWEFIAQATGHHCIPGISLRTRRKMFGNALLSRLPVRAVRLHDISVAGREPRGAIDVDIDWGGNRLRVIATHLGLRQPERCRQSEILAAIVGQPIPCDPESPECASGTVLLGDLNDWRGSAPSLRQLTRLFTSAASAPTFPARFPLFSLDRIMSRGNVQLCAAAAHRSRLARSASDHLPITATLSWTETAEPS